MKHTTYLNLFKPDNGEIKILTNDTVRILIVEDDDITAKLIEKILKDVYPCIDRVANGLEVLKKINNESYDIILLDIQIPIVNGYEVCLQLKSSPKTSDIPIIFITGKNDETDIQKAFEAGGNDYLTKPVKVTELLERIKLQLKIKEYINIIKNQNIELIEKEKKYRLINDNIVDVIWVTDMNLKHLYVSPSIKKFQGYEVEEFLNLDQQESLTEESFIKAKETIERYLIQYQKGEITKDMIACTIELQYYRKDGSIVWGELTATPFFDFEGNIVGIQGITRDITERKRNEIIIKENEAKFKSIFEFNLDCMFIVDLNLKIIKANKISLDIFKCNDEQELIGLSMYDISAEYQEGEQLTVVKMEELKEEIIAKNKHTFEWLVKRPNNDIFYAEVQVNVISNTKDNLLILVTVRDISEKKKLERIKQELSKAKEKKINNELDKRNHELAVHAMHIFQKNELNNKLLESLENIKMRINNDDVLVSDLNSIINDIKIADRDTVWNEFKMRFEEVHKDFYTNLLNKYPNLTNNEIKLCSFLKLSMSTRDISAITQQSVHALKIGRSRLRKKLAIKQSDNLIAFLSKF